MPSALQSRFAAATVVAVSDAMVSALLGEGEVGEAGRARALGVVEERALLGDAPALRELVVEHVEVLHALPGSRKLVEAIEGPLPPTSSSNGSPGSPRSPSRCPAAMAPP